MSWESPCSVSPHELMRRQTLLQVLYEGRCASLQRMVAFFVLFHAMGKTVQDFWPKISCGYLGYDMSKSHSIMRIATTASPVSGSEMRERVVQLHEAQRRKWAHTLIQSYCRMRAAKVSSEEEVMQMVLRGKLSQAQLEQIMASRGKRRRASVFTKSSGGDYDENDDNKTLPQHDKSDEVRAQISSACHGSALFAGMRKDQLLQAVGAMHQRSCAAGDEIITQGTVGDAFYVVESGVFTAHLKQAQDKEVARYESGGSFGELALLYDGPRAASVRCIEPGTLWQLECAVFRMISRRAGVDVQRLAQSALAHVPQLKYLTDEQRETLVIHGLEDVVVAAGEVFVHAGDEVDALFIIRAGGVTVSTAGAMADGSSTRLQAPSHLGAHSLEWPHCVEGANGITSSECSSSEKFWALTTASRVEPSEVPLPTWDVTAIADSTLGELSLWRLQREVLVELIGELVPTVCENQLLTILEQVAIFTDLAEHEKRRLAMVLQCKGYTRGDMIVQQGGVGDSMYIILSGTAMAYKEENKAKQRSHSSQGPQPKGEESATKEQLDVGTFFGEESLQKNEPYSASVRATSEHLTLAIISRAMLEGLLGSIEVVIQREQARRKRQVARARASTFQFSQLCVIGRLGMSTFGTMKLVRDGPHGRTFALKSMRKTSLVKHNHVEHAINEKEILALCDHPFCNSLVAVFVDGTHVHMMVDAALGGELHALLSRIGVLRDASARFYIACMACALSYLHGRKVIYRDLKPENILLDDMGYPKLNDFVFAKALKTEARTWTLCGTPDYLAPEVVTSQGHGLTVDWWALGVLAYEMLIGTTPFRADSELAMYKLICRGKINFPASVSASAKAFITGTLITNPMKRLGGGRRGGDEILSNAYLKGIDLIELQAMGIKPPYTPKVSGPEDTSNVEAVEVGDDITTVDDKSIPSLTHQEWKLNSAFSQL